MSEVPTATYLRSMARAVTGVTIVATDGAQGRYAQTVSAMCSVSAEPPILLVCINRRSPLAAAVRSNGVFAVSTLAAEHAEIADVFAGRAAWGGNYDFSRAGWHRLGTGAPIVAGAVAAFDCRVDRWVDSGTHRVFFGEVCDCNVSDGDPLTYTRRAYGRHVPLAGCREIPRFPYTSSGAMT